MPAMARRTAAVAAGRSADRIASEGGAETVYAAEETVSADVRPRLQRRLRLSSTLRHAKLLPLAPALRLGASKAPHGD